MAAAMVAGMVAQSVGQLGTCLVGPMAAMMADVKVESWVEKMVDARAAK